MKALSQMNHPLLNINMSTFSLDAEGFLFSKGQCELRTSSLFTWEFWFESYPFLLLQKIFGTYSRQKYTIQHPFPTNLYKIICIFIWKHLASSISDFARQFICTFPFKFYLPKVTLCSSTVQAILHQCLSLLVSVSTSNILLTEGYIV